MTVVNPDISSRKSFFPWLETSFRDYVGRSV